MNSKFRSIRENEPTDESSSTSTSTTTTTTNVDASSNPTNENSSTNTTTTTNHSTQIDPEEEEPYLKYQRLGGNVSEILRRDAASALGVHERFLVLGTHSGTLYVLDFNGNEIKRFSKHTATINAISIDPSGEWIGTGADDGRVVISSMYTDESLECSYSRPILALALDPQYATKTARPFCCGGREGRLIINTKGFFRAKDNVVHSGEGSIYAIAWRGSLIAWANDIGVKVYDTEASQRITYIARERPAPRADLYRASLRWLANDALLIGWADNVKLARVKQRTDDASRRGDLPTKMMEIVVSFETDFWVCGLAPFRSHLVALAYIDDDEEPTEGEAEQAGGSLRPELRVLSLANVERASDALTLHGYEQYRAADYALQVLPAAGLETQCDVAAMLQAAQRSLRTPEQRQQSSNDNTTTSTDEQSHGNNDDEDDVEAEWQYRRATSDDDTLFYVLAPKDLVVARPRDLDDHVSWLLALQRYEAALLAVDERRLTKHTLAGVGAQYIDHLLREGRVEAAAALCPKIIRDDAARWEQCVDRFARLQRLDAIAAHVPLSRPVLKAYVYELILHHFLTHDAARFLQLVDTWPSALYNIGTIITAVRERLKRDSSEPLMDALAKLYAYNGEYEHTLHIYLRLQRGDAFGLIAQRALHDKVRDKVRLLCEFDETRAIELLVNSIEQIPIAEVVEQLKPVPKTLHNYLHALFVRDAHVGRDYHEQQIALYADYAPALLLPFLRQSTYYRLERAYATCVERKLYKEQVFILGRMGNTKKALSLIMTEIGDVKQAIDFVVEHSTTMAGVAVKDSEDDELWNDLINHSLKSPKHVGELLEHVGGRVDPLKLIRRVPDGMAIDGLRDRLVKIIADYSLQCRLRDGCNSILKSDCVGLFQRLHAGHTAGRIVDPKGRCSVCMLSIESEGVRRARQNKKVDVNDNNNKDDENPSSTSLESAQDLVAFWCQHTYHHSCLTQQLTMQLQTNRVSKLFCTICQSTKEARRRKPKRSFMARGK